MEGLSHAVVGDLAKIGEGRFGGYGAEEWVGVERLKELGGSHGFAEGEDAAGVILCVRENRTIDGCRCVPLVRRWLAGRRWCRERGRREAGR